MSRPVGRLNTPQPVLTAPCPQACHASGHAVRPHLSLDRFLGHSPKERRRAIRSAAAAAWCSLQHPLIWEGSVQETKGGCSSFQQLSAPWKMMLLSDGSVTRHLQLMTGTDITADCMEMRSVDASQTSVAPAAVELLTAPLLQRQVLLRSSETGSAPLVYAASWWNQCEGSRLLQDASVPVGAVFRKQRVEVFRDIHTVYFGHCEELEDMLGTHGPMWGREYVFWHDGKPLTVIHEVFSPVLDEYLGSLGRASDSSRQNGSSEILASNGASSVSNVHL